MLTQKWGHQNAAVLGAVGFVSVQERMGRHRDDGGCSSQREFFSLAIYISSVDWTFISPKGNDNLGFEFYI